MQPGTNIQLSLANVPLFRELAAEELDRIAVRTREIRAARGEILFRCGEEARGLYVVVSGQIKLAFISGRGDEKVVDIVGSGQSFGEAVMFMEARHVVTARALIASVLLYIPRETIFEELERDPRFARRMIAGLSRRLHHLMGDLEAHSTDWSSCRGSPVNRRQAGHPCRNLSEFSRTNEHQEVAGRTHAQRMR